MVKLDPQFLVTAKELREALADFEDDALIFVNLPGGGKAPVMAHSTGRYLERHGDRVPWYVDLILDDVIPWDPT